MIPDRDEALKLLTEAGWDNPGLWIQHSLSVAHCAEKIAKASGMDEEKAYILGLLHDIGRKFSRRHLGHVSDGYAYMMKLGYDEVARVCLSHSFHSQSVHDYIGNFDTDDEELKMIRAGLAEMDYDDYDRLIQLCDAIGGADGVMDMEERMNDVESRYGYYPEEKRNANRRLKVYFEEKMKSDIYAICEKESFRPNMSYNE